MRTRTILGVALGLLLAVTPAGGREARGRVDAPCSREHTKRMVRSFVRAYNAGDLQQMDNLWAPEPEFQWYFVDDEREEDAESRDTLRSYFASRAMLDDRLEIRRLSVRPNGTDFGFKIRRTTDDERQAAAGLFHGKGAARESTALPSLNAPFPTPTCLLAVWAMDNHTE